jgi:hypothetical protein
VSDAFSIGVQDAVLIETTHFIAIGLALYVQSSWLAPLSIGESIPQRFWLSTSFDMKLFLQANSSRLYTVIGPYGRGLAGLGMMLRPKARMADVNDY